jgi:hypothetical protein
MRVDFDFIARNPPALLIAGGILFLLLQSIGLGLLLIFLGVILQIFYISKRY